MTREEEILIEKVIWLIEDSYPDTDEWGHDILCESIKEDLKRRADELNNMWPDAYPKSPWHKVADGDLPENGQHILMVHNTNYGNAYDTIFYPEPPITDEMDYWMEIPEINTNSEKVNTNLTWQDAKRLSR